MELIWNDGGRAASGFVGLAGDCVTRSIAIATGTSYRDVYRNLRSASESSPRDGVFTNVAALHLKRLGWQHHLCDGKPFGSDSLPKGVVVTHLQSDRRRSGHFCTVIDHVVHDTWNPTDDEDYFVQSYWTRPATAADPALTTSGSNRPAQPCDELTQKEFDKIMGRIRALDNTASNAASTEGEKRNALRMMQNLMLRHNLSREDITDDDNVESVRFTRTACPVNGRRACQWEKWLASYLIVEIFPTNQYYVATKGHRTYFWFYGPREDVQNCITLFRELLLTIATSARLHYGGHSRGSGASYCEGYVAGLPRHQDSHATDQSVVSETALIHARTLAVHSAAREWLNIECGIQLVSGGRSGRFDHDPDAANRGKKHGARHDVRADNGRKRIGRR